jgi:hypothetical protein
MCCLAPMGCTALCAVLSKRCLRCRNQDNCSRLDATDHLLGLPIKAVRPGLWGGASLRSPAVPFPRPDAVACAIHIPSACRLHAGSAYHTTRCDLQHSRPHLQCFGPCAVVCAINIQGVNIRCTQAGQHRQPQHSRLDELCLLSASSCVHTCSLHTGAAAGTEGGQWHRLAEPLCSNAVTAVADAFGVPALLHCAPL